MEGGHRRYNTLGALTFESLLVTRVCKVFLFKSKWPQTSLAASDPWVTMAASRFRQARAILQGIRTVDLSGTARCVASCVIRSPP